MHQAHGLWSTDTHALFPKSFRQTIFLLLLIGHRHFHGDEEGVPEAKKTEIIDLPPCETWTDHLMPYFHRDDFLPKKEKRPVRCEYCNAPGAKATCPKCHGGHYCNRETCWTGAWQDHKHRCSWFAEETRKKVEKGAKKWAKAKEGTVEEYNAFPPKTRKIADKMMAKRKEAAKALPEGGDKYTELVRELRTLETEFAEAPKVEKPKPKEEEIDDDDSDDDDEKGGGGAAA